MDLRKEIKFSDLLPKRRAKGEPKPKAEKAAREPRVSRFSRKN